MGRGHRKRHTGEVKARVALEAIRGMRTINEIASECGIHPTQIIQWKKEVLAGLPGFFSKKRNDCMKAEEVLKSRLYEEIGRMKVELEWLKKNHGLRGV